MTQYTHFVTLAIPAGDADILATAKACSKALDPDVGGEFAFDLQAQTTGQDILDADGNPQPNPSAGTQDWIVYGSPVTEHTSQAIQYFQATPAALQAAVTADYTNRWPDLTPPTLGECQAFCDAVLISTEQGTLAGMAELGLVLLPPLPR